MHYDFAQLSAADRYKLVTSVVVPRPIAWVSTLNPSGGVNLAPYSFFNLLGSDPAVVAFSPGNRPDGSPKDTARNIAAGGEFVVNMVDEALADAMNLTATDFPPDMDEAGVAGLPLTPGTLVRVPRVSASPAALECREVQTLTVGNNRIILGEVLGLFLRGDLLLDAERHHVDTPGLKLIGRMGGRGGYTRTQDGLEIGRMTYAEWQKKGS